MGLYPSSVDSAVPGMTYGDLPDHGFENVKLVLHTTETKGMPSFNDGATAPHYVYAPLTGLWTMWAEYDDGRVGTMKGHATNHANDSAFQVEILGYSDQRHSPWVGDFTDRNYQDLAEFYGWAMTQYPIGAAVTPTPAGGFKYGVSAPTRGTEAQYNAFSGLTCHGWVYGNSHWDTGILDLDLIHDLATGGDMPTYRTVLNVPDTDWAHKVVDHGIDNTKIINVEDAAVDDWEDDNVTMGRMWTLFDRYDRNNG